MAENVLFLSPRLSDAATLAASSAVTSLPVTNLQHQEPTKKWRTTGITAEWVTIDAGRDVVWNAAAIAGHNLSATATLRVRGKATADVTSSPSVDTTAVSAWPSSGKHSEPDWPHECSLVRWTNTTAYRYWRLDIADPLNAAAYLDVGRLALGKYFQPGLNADIDGGIGFASTDVQEATPYGQVFTDARPFVARTFDIPFSAANADDVHDGAMELSRLHGLAGDVFCFLDPSSTTRFHKWSMQGLFTGRGQYKPQPLFDPAMMWGFSFSMIQKL
jgi:hypothetical protein